MIVLVIQLTDSEAVIARFQRRRDSLAFLQGSRRPIPADGSLVGILDGFAAAGEEQKVILSLPPSLVYARELTMPIVDRRRAREVIALEVGNETALQSDDLLFDAIPLTEGKAMAVWCRQREVAELIDRLAAIGSEPEVVTAGHLHWNHLLPPDTAEPCAVTDGTALMVGTAATPLFVRAFTPDEGEQELARTLTALEYGREIVVSRTLHHGREATGAATFSFTQQLRDAFGGDTSAALDLAGAFAVAKAWTRSELVNFRTGPLAYTAGQVKNRRRLRITLGLAGCLALLLFVELGVRYYLVRRDVTSLDASILKIYRGIFPSRQKPVDAVAEVKSEIRRLSGGEADQRVLPALKQLAELKGEDIAGFYEVELDGTQLRLKGDARSAQAVNAFKERAASLITSPEVSEIKTKNDGGVSFSFRGTVKEGNR